MSPSFYGLKILSNSRFFRFSPLPFISVVTFVLILLLFSKNAHSADITLAWNPNSEEDLAGYRLFYREEGQSYNYNDPLWEGSETTCTVYNLDDTTSHCFVVRAVDTSANESSDSNEVCYQPSFNVNVAPTADAGPDQTVDEGVTVTLDGTNSTDADGNIASYLWMQKAGASVTLSGSASAQPTFTAPYVGLTGEALTFQLTVTDDGGLADTDTVIINVSNVNQAPTADAGPDQTVDEADTVTLDGSNSSDPDGTVVSYHWVQAGGSNVTLSETTAAQPIFTAPDVGLDGASLTFQLTVTDDGGLQSTDTCIVNVSWVNIAPTADAGPDQTVDEGVTVTLDGANSTDADGAIASYLWTQKTGTSVTLSDAMSARPIFTAPYVGLTGEALTFQLTVTDNGGLADTDTVIINVSNVNQAPTADAGPDQTVDETDTVTLDGSNSSDPDGAVVSYHWAQIKGSAVTLSEATAAQPIFTAPNVGPDGASLTFQLTVTDDGGLQSTDTCIVNVSWVNMAPTADAGPDQTVDEDMTVTLDGANSTDADGAIASYLWMQKAGASVTLSGSASAQSTFTAPHVGLTGEALTFQLTVADNGGLADTDTVIINVSNVNQAPTAYAGPDQATDEGMTVTLDGSNSSDPDDAIESYLWTQTHGKPVTLSNPRAVRPTFTGPFVRGASEALDFQLTVNDQGGLSDGDGVTVTVNPSPSGPVQTIFDLQAKASATAVRLDWSLVPEATCYNVYRGLSSGGPYTRIADCHVTDKCTYLDSDLMMGAAYYYVVRSVIGGVESLDSNRVGTTLKGRRK